MLRELASDSVIESAYRWLCRQRCDWPASCDVWDLRHRWSAHKPALKAALLAGNYRFEPLERVHTARGEVVHVWSARDSLVLKALALVLAKHLPLSPRCMHVKGHGGAKAAVRGVHAELPCQNFVLRTDVKSYYDSIDQQRMLEMLASYVKERSVLNLLWQAMRRTATWGGLFAECRQGISRGCPLSPLLGAFFLHELDCAMGRLGPFYIRFMDDILVLAPTRSKLRRAVRVVNAELSALGLEKHPEKTFIGRIERGFDFLGYHFSREGLAVARKASSSSSSV